MKKSAVPVLKFYLWDEIVFCRFSSLFVTHSYALLNPRARLEKVYIVSRWSVFDFDSRIVIKFFSHN